MTPAMWFCSLVTLASALVSLGYAVASLRSADSASAIASSYALARSTALVIIAAVAPLTGSLGFVAAAAVAMICVQLLDVGIGARTRDRLTTVGPAITGLVNAAALLVALTS